MRNKIASYISPQASENGSVCLAMLSAYYGKRIPLIRAAQLCGVTQDGCSMEQISGGAGSLGFETELCTVDPEALLSAVSIVFQDVTLFNQSVMENIRMGRKGATDAEVLENG